MHEGTASRDLMDMQGLNLLLPGLTSIDHWAHSADPAPGWTQGLSDAMVEEAIRKLYQVWMQNCIA